MARAQLRSFGDAEGYGAAASGGRAITSATSIYHVTNLNDAGTGSFRDAVSGSNRIVVFDVGGEIKLTSGGISSQGNITIAGQTAPGAGVTITGYQAIGFTQRSNIIMRYLRLRPGDASPASDNGMSMTRTGTAILDHVSIEFGKYNNIDAVADTADAPRITIQHSIIADPISTGTDDRGQGFGAHLEAVNGYYTISNNLWANSHSRNPLAKVNEQFKNNVEYNNEIGYLTSGTSTPFSHDLVNNAFIAGPDYTSSSDYGQLSTPDKFYASGNVQDANQDGVFNGATSNPTGGTSFAAPLHATTNALPTLSATDAYAYVLAHAGASLSRDQLDQLVIGQVQTLGSGTAGYTAGTTGPTSQTVPSDPVHDGLYYKANLTGLANGGLGVTLGSSRAAGFDVDNDGIADAWELAHGLNPNDASDAVKTNALGYLEVEQYVNELGDQNATAAWTNAAVAPGPYTHATIRGTGAANTTLTFNATPGVAAAPQALSLSIGGNGPAAGETVNVVGGGRLNVYDTITVGEFGNATLNVAGGTVSAWNVQLGNTDFSAGTGVSYAGALNLSSGTLNVSQIAPGAGTPGAFTSGGTFNWSGGTVLAAGGFSISASTVVTGAADTLNTNGFDGQLTALSGAGTLTKAGAGTLTLGGNNSAFSGAIKLNAGAISLATVAPVGANASVTSSTGTITAANGTTVNVVSSNSTTPLALAGGASVTLAGGGVTYGGAISGVAGTTLVVSTTTTGNFSLGGNLAAFAGTADLGASAGNVRINGGGSALASFNLGTSTGAIRTAFGNTTNLGSLAGGASTKLTGPTNDAVATTFSVGANGASTTFAGTIGDGTFATPAIVSLTKVGAGTLALSNAASTYSGVTKVSGGTLGVATLANGGAASSIGDSSNAAANLVLDGGRLRHVGAAATTDRLFTVTANGGGLEASGTGALIVNGAGAVAQSGVGDRTFTLGGTSTAFSNFYLDLADPTSGKLSLAKEGAGTWRLFGNARTYSGDTTVAAGTLYLVTAGVLPTSAGKGNLTVDGTLDMAGNSHTINGLNGAGFVTTTSNTARTLTVGNGDASGSFAGTLTQGASQTLALTKVGAGTQALGGTSNYAGSTAVNAGTLVVNGALVGTGAVTVAANATLGGSGSIAGAVTVANNGKLAPGNSPGTLNLNGGVTLNAGADLVVELDGTTVGAGYDQVNVAGSVALANADLVATLGYAPAVGDKLFIVNNDAADAIVGRLAGLADGATLSLTSSTNGQSYAFAISYFGDADGNLTTGGNDVVLTRLAAAAVPEPTTLAALALAGLGVRRVRRPH